MPNKYISLITLLSDTKFEFDGVIYSNPHAKALFQKGLFNNLTSASRIVEGKPKKNELSYLFKTESGTWVLTTNKRWDSERTIESYSGKRFDLLLIQKTT